MLLHSLSIVFQKVLEYFCRCNLISFFSAIFLTFFFVCFVFSNVILFFFLSFQDWALRSEEQSLLIERILVLIRNVLQVPANPEAECRADNDASIHDQVIWALHQSGILDLVLFIISSPDENQFHLHCLEIVCLLYREQVSSLFCV